MKKIISSFLLTAVLVTGTITSIQNINASEATENTNVLMMTKEGGLTDPSPIK